MSAIIGRLRRRPRRVPVKVGGGIWYVPPRDMPPGIHIDVYQTPNQFLMNGSVWNRQTGFRQAAEPIITVALDASDRELGEAVLSVSAVHHGKVVESPMPEGNFWPILARAAGMKRWSDFAPPTRCVGVLHDGPGFTLHPSRNETTRHPRSGWFWSQPQRQLDAPRPAELGAAIRAVMADCTFAPPIKHRKDRKQEA
jgi:hypothetical protein